MRKASGELNGQKLRVFLTGMRQECKVRLAKGKTDLFYSSIPVFYLFWRHVPQILIKPND